MGQICVRNYHTLKHDRPSTSDPNPDNLDAFETTSTAAPNKMQNSIFSDISLVLSKSAGQMSELITQLVYLSNFMEMNIRLIEDFTTQTQNTIFNLLKTASPGSKPKNSASLYSKCGYILLAGKLREKLTKKKAKLDQGIAKLNSLSKSKRGCSQVSPKLLAKWQKIFVKQKENFEKMSCQFSCIEKASELEDMAQDLIFIKQGDGKGGAVKNSKAGAARNLSVVETDFWSQNFEGNSFWFKTKRSLSQSPPCGSRVSKKSKKTGRLDCSQSPQGRLGLKSKNRRPGPMWSVLEPPKLTEDLFIEDSWKVKREPSRTTRKPRNRGLVESRDQKVDLSKKSVLSLPADMNESKFTGNDCKKMVTGKGVLKLCKSQFSELKITEEKLWKEDFGDLSVDLKNSLLEFRIYEAVIVKKIQHLRRIRNLSKIFG